eukprot:1013578_1
MDAIANSYQSSDDDNDADTTTTNNHSFSKPQSTTITLAPNINTTTQSTAVSKYHEISTKEIFHNPKADILFGPIEGPLRPNTKSREQEFKPKQTTLCGYVEVENVDGLSLAEQYHTYE